MIPYTKPFLPPKEEYMGCLDGIWERNWLTNMGPLSEELESKLKEHLGVKHVLYVANGTLALQLAIRALDLRGEIITTPFSFIATTSSIVWEKCKPVFADIDPRSLNATAENIEKAITKKTSAILVTHIFGNPCDTTAIRSLADTYKLRVIYDGAHAFGVTVNNSSVYNYGDISVCSLHATKVYHSIEGGLVVSNDDDLIRKIAFMRNFGFNGPEKFSELGINAKNSEFHAAMGLVNLRYIDKIVAKRKHLSDLYDEALENADLKKQEWHREATRNYGFYPVIFNDETGLEKSLQEMSAKNIFPRRYFYPPLPVSVPYVRKVQLPVSGDISRRTLCLPLFHEMTAADVDSVCRCIGQQ